MRVYEREACRLASSAASTALHRAGVSSREITHLVTVSCTGFSAPGLDIDMVRELGLPSDLARTHVGFMGCHGLLNGLRVARAFATADPAACVLVTAVELCSLHHQYGWNPEQIVANALFADGAAAVVCIGGNQGTSTDLRLLASSSSIIPNTRDLMSWRIRDHGFEMSLSPRVPEVIRAHLRPWLESWLDQYGRTLADIDGWAIHPGGPRILQACAATLDLPPAAVAPSQQVLAEYGNMSSPTVLFILERLVSRPASGLFLLLAFGPGLTVEAALVGRERDERS
jgi:predicted naringenin-chalcone synthase